MKTINFILMALMITGSAFADKGVEHGNGGDGFEVEFKSISIQILQWVHKNLEANALDQKLLLTKNGIDAVKFENELTDVIEKKAKIKFTDEQVSVAGSNRTCKNDPSSSEILCNRATWSKVSGPARYGIVLHEYLGLIGYESNTGEYSQYPVSPNIVRYVFVTQKYELGMEVSKTNPVAFPNRCMNVLMDKKQDLWSFFGVSVAVGAPVSAFSMLAVPIGAGGPVFWAVEGSIAAGAAISLGVYKHTLDKRIAFLKESEKGNGKHMRKLLEKVRKDDPTMTMTKLANAIHQADLSGALCEGHTMKMRDLKDFINDLINPPTAL